MITCYFQVVGYQEKICKLEQEKEHWMLESQLIEMKYTKECQVGNFLKTDIWISTTLMMMMMMMMMIAWMVYTVDNLFYY